MNERNWDQTVEGRRFRVLFERQQTLQRERAIPGLSAQRRDELLAQLVIISRQAALVFATL